MTDSDNKTSNVSTNRDVIINNAAEILQKKIKSNDIAIQILGLDKYKYAARRAADAASIETCDEKLKLIAELNAELNLNMKNMTDWREEYCQNLVSQLNELDSSDYHKDLYERIHKYDALIANLMAQRDAIEATIPATAEITQYKFKANSCHSNEF